MTGDGEEETECVLASHRLYRRGLQVKLDKGFDDGTYCVYVEFDELVDRVGFAAARRTAGEYCAHAQGADGSLAGPLPRGD